MRMPPRHSRVFALVASAMVLVTSSTPAAADNGPTDDLLYEQSASSAMLPLSLEIPSLDLAKKCTVRIDIHAEYDKPRGSWNIDEKMWGKATPKNCDAESLPGNFLMVELTDEGSPMLSQTYQTTEHQTVSGSTINFTQAAQRVPTYTFPTDHHVIASRITFDWTFFLQFGSAGNPVRICAHAEAIIPAPIKGGWVACDG